MSALPSRLSTLFALLDQAISRADEVADPPLVRLLEDAKRTLIQAQTEALRVRHAG